MIYANFTLTNGENDCTYELETHCRKVLNSKNEFILLQCLMSDTAIVENLSDKCHNFLWKRRVQLTQSTYFNTASNGACSDDLNRINECKIISDLSASKIPCLFDHKAEVQSKTCFQYLELVGEIILSDYRLVYKFIFKCESDIKKHKCGRVNTGSNMKGKISVASQGSTIDCLTGHIEKLDQECAHEIFRISELQSDDYHLDRPLFYACRDDRERFCQDIMSGDGRIFNCLMEHKFDDGMSEDCRKRMTARQKLRSHHYRADFMLATKCKKAIIEHDCSVPGSENASLLSSLLLCLEAGFHKNGKKTDSSCLFQVKSVRKQLMEDYSLTPEILTHCQKPIDSLCTQYKESRRGAVLHCLLGIQRGISKSLKSPLPIECQKALHDLTTVTDVIEDVRVDPVIRRSCGTLLTTRCSTTVISEHDVYQCLLNNRDDTEMTDVCRQHLFELEFFVSRDITLDRSLYEACVGDAEKLCHYSTNQWKQHRMADPLLVNCLWSHRHPPRSGDDNRSAVGSLSAPCLHEVSNLMVVRASSVDLNPEVFQACLADLGRYCSHSHRSPAGSEDEDEEDDDEEEVEEGVGCLEDHLNQLQPPCREALVHYARDVEEEPDLDRRIARSCLSAEKRFCQGLPNSVQRIISQSEAYAAKDEEVNLHDLIFECLVEHKTHSDMEPACRIAIEHFQILSLKDVRISRSFYEDCHESIVQFCPSMKVEGAPPVQMSKMAAVMCLSRSLMEQKLRASSANASILLISPEIPETCARHIRFELLSRSESLALDPILAQACETDRKRFCAHVPDGFGEVIECFREHRNRLSARCHEELFNRDQLVMADSRLDFKFMSTCKGMIQSHCGDNSVPGSTLLECLRRASKAMGDVFDASCRRVVYERLQTQRLDHRLNPRLISNCHVDVKLLCSSELRSDNSRPFEHDNTVLQCLQRQYVQANTNQGRESLTPPCAKYMRELLVSTNLNYYMDPLLAEVCQNDLSEHCSEELALSGPQGKDSDGAVLECLRQQVAQNKVRNDSCIVEVLRLVLISKADVDGDPVLARDCAGTLSTICSKIIQGGGRQMKCLLDALDSNDPGLESACRRSLGIRRELWEMSAKRPDLLDWRVLMKEINASHSRNLIIGIVLTLLGAIFIVGLCCGRCSKRVVRINLKNR